MFGSPKHAASRPLLLGVALAAVAVPASAGTPMHIKRAFGPIAGDAPAGTLCDFAYHEEDTGTQNLTRFTDEAGNLVRVEDQVDVTILHRNSDTGTTLIEHLHYAAYVDFVNGRAGVWWTRRAGSCWAARGSSRPTSSPATSLPKPRRPKPVLPRRSAPRWAAPRRPEVHARACRTHSTDAEPAINQDPERGRRP